MTMIDRKRNQIKLFIIILTLILSGGCWDHLPAEDAAFVSLIGIDADPQGADKTVVTYVIADPSAIGGAGGSMDDGGAGSGTPFYLVSVLESSFEAAFMSQLQFVPGRPLLTHLRAVIIGEEYAKQSVSPLLSRILRQVDIRETVDIIVSAGHAQALVDARPVLEPLPGDALADLIALADLTGVSRRVPIYEFGRNLLTGRRDPVAPFVERVRPLQARVPPDFVQQPIAQLPSASNEIRVSGLAVFKKDKMVGTLLGNEARGADWIFGFARGSYSATHPTEGDHNIGMEVLRSRTKIKPSFSDGRLEITFDLDVTATLKEIGALRQENTAPQIPQLEKAFETAVTNDIHNAMTKLQTQLGADIFGVADTIYRNDPNLWEELEPLWDEIYADADIHVNIKINLSGTGLLR